MVKLQNLYLAFKVQFPWKRAFRNFFITKNAWGMFSKYSHIRQDTNQPKVSYHTLDSAKRAAENMSKKYGKHFSVYKCIYCDGLLAVH